MALTTGVDNVTATTVTGDLTPYSFNGVGPTLNSGDKISGVTGKTNNVFNIQDQYGQGVDIIPIGATISNEQTINLVTAGNAGGSGQGNNGIASGVFDVTGISGLQAVTVTSQGAGVDSVRAEFPDWSARSTSRSTTSTSTVSAAFRFSAAAT